MKTANEPATLSVTREPFGSLKDGSDVDRYTLTNACGSSVSVITYGGTITQCLMSDSRGSFESVVLGFDNLQQYLEPHPRFGALIGRFANRIAGAEFRLDERQYKLAATKGTSTLHGGVVGFDKKVWKAEVATDQNAASLKLHYVSADMEEGFPGNLDIDVTYRLNNDNCLSIEYEATTDKATPVNFTNHSYFNLAGAGKGSVLDHIAQFNAKFFTPVDESLIPTGEIRSVHDTPFDFLAPVAFGKRIEQTGAGYDHNLVVTGTESDPWFVGTVSHLGSGRTLTIHTDQPAFQLFTANGLNGAISGIGGAYEKHGGFCIETQHFPDSVHHRHFPSTILRPGVTFRSFTRYTFGVA